VIPGTYNIPITENSTNTYSFVISGITTATSYSASVDIRATSLPTSNGLLSLSSPSSGLTLSSDGASLTIVMVITETQADTLIPLVVAANGKAAWSLKVTAPAGTTLQYLTGLVVPTRTPTN